MYINKAIIYGNLTRDPELKSLPSGIQVATLAVATNRRVKDKNGTWNEMPDYHNVVVFGNQAAAVAQYLKKGSGVFVEGRMQTRSWDAADGQKKYRTEIVADRVQFGPKGGATTGGGNYNKPSDTGSGAPKEDESSAGGSIEYPQEEINAEDIPF